ncbi:hypothetical protein F4821DRAFT_252406 [Hypoxylon rubiginosum]|uniref:Uncharacterized protein n=2 Tax=Hypoxylon rubiginosum TaxID=110542 RepID=A0ACB9Z1X8_9PEZI|nr:hypothetical protein F4820DRAFT_458238 [Hypoxylon rubiginosum]KAI6080085.1 hypothetical protein F4821DRAFT_252406 [Hypoxylon rubiginosum]
MPRAGALLFSFLPLLFPLAIAIRPNITAINARNGRSTLECWELRACPFTWYEPGTVSAAIAELGATSNLSMAIIDPSFDNGLHHAPAKQWVMYTSGLVHITLPDDNSTSAYVSGGEFGLVFAADTADISRQGHRTRYLGTSEVIALQIPTKDGEVPAHTVLHEGPCDANEVVGLRKLVAEGTSYT